MKSRPPFPIWFPFIGWVDIPDEDAFDLGLPPGQSWRAFLVEWFGFGITLFVEPRE